jgi:capsular polysaccharide transport system permease protein
MPTAAVYKRSVPEGIRVINALMLREIKTRFGDNHLGFAWLFIEPLMFTVPVILFWSASRAGASHGLPFVEFMMTGYPPFIMWRNCVSRSQAAITGNAGLLYHRMITPARIVLARSLLEVAGSFLSTGLIYIGFWYIGWVRAPSYFSYFLFGWIYMGIVSWACAVLLCSLGEASKVMAKILGTFNYLMLAIGGAFYLVDWMPLKVQPYVVWIPTVQAFELIRYGYFGEAIRTHWSPLHLLICALVPAVFGLHILKVAREHMELE